MSLPKYWRERPQRNRLEAGKCSSCGKSFFPPSLVCSNCGGREFSTYILPETGKVATYTIIRVAPSDFTDQVPYAVGIIEFDGGVKVLMQVVDCPEDKLEVGMRVRIEFRKIISDGVAGAIFYGYKAVPDFN